MSDLMEYIVEDYYATDEFKGPDSLFTLYNINQR